MNKFQVLELVHEHWNTVPETLVKLQNLGDSDKSVHHPLLVEKRSIFRWWALEYLLERENNFKHTAWLPELNISFI